MFKIEHMKVLQGKAHLPNKYPQLIVSYVYLQSIPMHKKQMKIYILDFLHLYTKRYRAT